MNKKILIVCYSFPPFPGIGGRRWAKFAKYFAENGVECHVISAFNYSKSKSIWNADTDNPNIKIHPLKFRFQYWMGLYSSSFSYRIFSKLIRTVLNLTKYSPYFSTSISKKILLEKCTSIIREHNIDTVVASGDPYMQYYVTELKKTSKLHVIIDYRDTWNDRPKYYLDKFHKLSNKQRAFFEFSENESLKNCDEVVSVYEPIIDKLSARSGKNKTLFHLIPNGFDKNDYTNIKALNSNSSTITLYFGGNISPGDIADYFLGFLESFTHLKKQNKLLWEKFRVEINGDCPAYFEEELKKWNNTNIILQKGFLAFGQYIEKLENSAFGILSIPDEYSDCLFITKAYDYLYLEKPILYLGKKGLVSKFIDENRIGYAFNPDENADNFFEKLANSNITLQYTKAINEKIREEYDIANLSKRYLDLLGLKN